MATPAPDGKTFAYFAGNGDQFLLADQDTGKTIRAFEGKFRANEDSGLLVSDQGILFSPNGKIAAACEGSMEPGSTNTIWLWDVATGRLAQTLKWKQKGGACTAPWLMAFSTDGQTLVSSLMGGGEPIRVWDMRTGKSLHVFGGRDSKVDWEVLSVAISPDGKTMATGTDTGSVHLWQLPSGKKLAEVRTGIPAVNCLAFSPDGRTIASGGKNVIRLDPVPMD